MDKNNILEEFNKGFATHINLNWDWIKDVFLLKSDVVSLLKKKIGKIELVLESMEDIESSTYATRKTELNILKEILKELGC